LFAEVGASIGCVAVVMLGAPCECRVDFEMKVPRQCACRAPELRDRVACKRNGLRDDPNQSETGGKSAVRKEFVLMRMTFLPKHSARPKRARASRRAVKAFALKQRHWSIWRLEGR